MTRRLTLAACAALLCANVAASGSGEPYDSFVNRAAPDQGLARYQAGELGVILPGYERMYLYAAWRSIMLGAPGLKAAPNPDGGLARAIGSQTGGWLDIKDGAKTYAAWQAALAVALKQPAPQPRNGDLLASGYLNCPLPAYAFATSTLLALSRRSDATGARLSDWIASQKQVFKFCGDDPDAVRPPDGTARPAIAALAELPASSALYWRQMQQYQLAAAAFYSGDFATSGQRFAQIGETEQHPLRQWGAYLSLRSLARAASQAARPGGAPAAAPAPQEQLAAIGAAAERIVRDPSLAALHEAARAVVRAARVRLTPEARFAELSQLLDDPHADPYLDDHLGDWRVLANQLLSEWAPKAHYQRAQQIRAATGFIDWIETLQACAASAAPAGKAGADACAGQRAHAAAEWRRHGAAGDQARARVWLVAAAAMAGVMAPALEQAARRVPAGAPEYLTLRYALARHYRLSGQSEQARACADAILAGAASATGASVSARNLFLQERFALASSPADAANYLLRTSSRKADADTGESAPAPEQPQPAADGLRWLNAGLATADLAALAANPQLAAPLRIAVGTAAWMRADLLGQTDTALRAAQQLEPIAPALAPVLRQYRTLAGAPERRHWMLLNALRYGLSPVVGMLRRNEDIKARAPAETLADMWCNIPAGTSAYGELNTAAEKSPPPPETGGAAARAVEIAALNGMKTATGFVGDHVMQRAATVPADPDLPWLLYAVVQSTRGGCLDADAKTLSRKAFGLLHKRFGNSEWAAKTPYFY